MALTKVSNKGLADDAVTADKIADGTVVASDIADGTITNAKLVDATVENAKLANSSITINGTSIALGASGDIVAGLDWQAVKTSSFTAVAGEGYFVNTSGGAVTVTLPASPSIGDFVGVVDYGGNASNNNITIARNGSNIQGAASDRTVAQARVSEVYVYSDSTQGWMVQSTTIDPPVFITATGGTVSTSGNYKIHTFTSSGCFSVSCVGNQTTTVDYLVVAGGGGGGEGGGGAGGYRESSGNSGPYTASPLATPTGISVCASTYPITVGAGGSGQAHQFGGLKGSNSVFSTITSTGGGGGGPAPDSVVQGGSAGGREPGVPAPQQAGNTPPVSPPQGNPGGSQGGAGFPSRHGGGGGALEAGCTDGTAYGGDGASSEINGSAVTRAGGGGGGFNAPTVPAPGGDGGGGNGSATDGTAATANTGGGGGGGWNNGCNGGSGIVIIRYRYQ